jgi:hypothetical protein
VGGVRGRTWGYLWSFSGREIEQGVLVSCALPHVRLRPPAPAPEAAGPLSVAQARAIE